MSLPVDLTIRHYRKYQTYIASDTTSEKDRERIEKVRLALNQLNPPNTNNSNNNTSSTTTDPDDELTAQMAQLSLGDNNSNDYMSTEQEQQLISRYQPELITEFTKPRRIPVGTPIAFPSDTTKPLIIVTREITLSDNTNTTDPIDSWDRDDTDIKENGTDTNQVDIQTPAMTQFKKLPATRKTKIKSFINAIHAIGQAKNIVVVAGAGISVSSGIPDFRSSNGLYSLLKNINLGAGSQFNLDPNRFPPQRLAADMEDFQPEDLFAMRSFVRNPVPFYTFYYQMGISGDVCKPTPMHKFIKLLEDRGQLRRLYTQNIDNLEGKAGIRNSIACHGNDNEFYCLDCGLEIETKFLQPWLVSKDIPFCATIRKFLYNHYFTTACELESQGVNTNSCDQVPMSSKALKKCLKRTSGQNSSLFRDTPCDGLWKPRIVFFGESLPPKFFQLLKEDNAKADLIIVMGTSLQVSPVATIPVHLSLGVGKLSPIQADISLLQMEDSSHYYATIIKTPSLSTGLTTATTTASTGPKNYSQVPECDLSFVNQNYVLEQYLQQLSRNNQDTIHLDQLTRDLTHVPIIAINRDSLFPQNTYGSSQPLASPSKNNKQHKPVSTEKSLQDGLESTFKQQYTLTPLSYQDDLVSLTRQKISINSAEEDDLSDGDYDDWVRNTNDDNQNNIDDYNFDQPLHAQQINSSPSPYLNRLDYEFLGNADDISQFITKVLGW